MQSNRLSVRPSNLERSPNPLLRPPFLEGLYYKLESNDITEIEVNLEAPRK